MKRILLILSATLLISAPLAAMNPEELNSISFYNDSGFDILYLFFSPGDSEEWGADLLGSTRTLLAGQEVEFFLHYPEACNTFDFMAIDEDGDTYYIWDYEICDGKPGLIEISLDQYDPNATVRSNFAEVNLRNDTPYEMYFVFVSPSDSEMWGVDMLDAQTILEPGNALSLLVPVSKEVVSYDVLAVDEDTDDYSFRVELNSGETSYTWAIEMSDLQ
jgi:hypothetical protein